MSCTKGYDHSKDESFCFEGFNQRFLSPRVSETQKGIVVIIFLAENKTIILQVSMETGRKMIERESEANYEQIQNQHKKDIHGRLVPMIDFYSLLVRGRKIENSTFRQRRMGRSSLSFSLNFDAC